MSKKRRWIIVFIIIVATILIICGSYLFFNSSFYIYTKIAPKGSLVTTDIILRDMNYFSKLENMFLSNNSNCFLDFDKMQTIEKEYFSERIINNTNGKVLWLELMKNKNTLNGFEKPFEVRFAIRTMLYLKERVLEDEYKNFRRIYGDVETYDLNNVISFINSKAKPFNMSVEEFDEIYNSVDLTKLSINKKVDLLTQKWIEKTMYFRPLLYGNKTRPLNGLKPKEKLYLVCRDVYFEFAPSGGETCQIIVDLFERENVEKYLNSSEKEKFKKFYEVAKKTNMRTIGNMSVLHDLFFGKSLSETVEISRTGDLN